MLKDRFEFTTFKICFFK